MRTRLTSLLIFCLFGDPTGGPAWQKTAPVVLIVYYSESGHTRELAGAVAIGAGSVKGVEVILRSVSEVDSSEVRSAAAVIVGTPVFNAAVSPQVQAFVNSWPFDGTMKNKIGAAFTTGGGISAGEELVQVGILHSMLVFGMVVVGGEDWTSAFGASGVTNEGPFHKGPIDKVFREKGQALGKRVAELVLRFWAGNPQ